MRIDGLWSWIGGSHWSASELMLGTLVIGGPAAFMVLGPTAFVVRDRPAIIAPASRAANETGRTWVCVTPKGFCPTVPMPSGDPCSCPDALEGSRPGHTLSYTTSADRDWPARGAAAGDDPMEGLLWGP